MRTRLLIVFCSLLLVASVQVSAASAAFIFYRGHARYKPTTFSGNHVGFTHMVWHRWGRTAVATADASWSFPADTVTFHSARGLRVRFSRIRTMCVHRVYTEVRWRYPGGSAGSGGLTDGLCFWSGF